MSRCLELEPYALRVIGDAMAPELPGGAVVVVEPAASAPDGAYVVADTPDGVQLGRYRRSGSRRWLEVPGEAQPLAEGAALRVRGIVVERAPGRGLARKRYPRALSPGS